MFGEVFMSYKEYKLHDGSFRRQWMAEEGKLHREDLPAEIYYYPDGSIQIEHFCLNGVQHRELGPAVILYYPDGLINMKSFYIKGKPHRELGPAFVSYNSDGSIEREDFHLNGDFLGYDKKGFWALWSRLTDDKRNNPEILKCLARFS
jgi:antitoxin component YwqK of YwqJK toxin-antitoxin module